MYRRRVLVAIGVVSVAASAAAFNDFDFGLFREHMLDSHSEQLFGIVGPVDESSGDSITRNRHSPIPPLS